MHEIDTELHYETIECRARPARLAVLIDSSDREWQFTAVRAIEFLSSVWGGKHSLIIPTSGIEIQPIFWDILEKFSPDYVYAYRNTWGDIKISNPQDFAAQPENHLNLYHDEILSLEGEREKIQKNLEQGWASGFHPARDLCSQLAERLVPFHFQNQVEPISCNGAKPHQLTRISDVLPCVDHPQHFTSFDVPFEVNPLWWIAQTGKFAPAHSERLSEIRVSAKNVLLSEDDLSGFANWIAEGTLNAIAPEIDELLGGKRGFLPPSKTEPIPFDLSMAGVALYGPPLAFHDFKDSFALVLGDSIEDFCLSYCLPRVGRRAAWLPSTWIDGIQSEANSVTRTCALSTLYSVPVDVRLKSGPSVCSSSKTPEQIQDVFEILKRRTSYGLNGERFNPVTPIQAMGDSSNAAVPYCIDTPNHSEIYPFVGVKSVGAIRTPRPVGFTKLSASKHRWVAEVAAAVGRPNGSPHRREVVPLPGSSATYPVRVSHQAPCLHCPGSLVRF